MLEVQSVKAVHDDGMDYMRAHDAYIYNAF
jgi:hypothetical protein